MSAIEMKFNPQSRADPDRIQAPTLGANESGYSRNSPNNDIHSKAAGSRIIDTTPSMNLNTKLKSPDPMPTFPALD
jgi:hypothetical protein